MKVDGINTGFAVGQLRSGKMLVPHGNTLAVELGVVAERSQGGQSEVNANCALADGQGSVNLVLQVEIPTPASNLR